MGLMTDAGAAHQNRGFRRIVFSLIGLVIVPTALLAVVGIVMLVFYEARLNVLFGILVISLVALLITGAVLALIFIRHEAKLSKLQLDFVSKVSHELRTPLTSIRMFVETLQYEHDQQKVQTCLDVLSQETTRLSERIERLLDWGRMEAGKRAYGRLPERVETVVDQAVAELRTSLLNKPRRVRVSVAPELPMLQLDRGAMVDALVNLLTNAHKYSPPEAPIEVEAFREGNEVWLTVTDEGNGIELGEQKRIFEKFYRVDDRLARTVEGSGLGLSIVQHIVHAHGGTVDVRSARGHGSTFILRLPIPPRGRRASQRGQLPTDARAAGHQAGSASAQAGAGAAPKPGSEQG